MNPRVSQLDVPIAPPRMPALPALPALAGISLPCIVREEIERLLASAIGVHPAVTSLVTGLLYDTARA
jgi:hypothetical protein